VSVSQLGSYRRVTFGCIFITTVVINATPFLIHRDDSMGVGSEERPSR
jgi:hypothetical protein